MPGRSIIGGATGGLIGDWFTFGWEVTWASRAVRRRVGFLPIVAIGAGIRFVLAVWVGAHEMVIP